MKQLDARWFQWSRYDAERRRDEHGYFLAGEGGKPGVLVDPVPFAEGDAAHVEELGGAEAVVLTGPWRQEEARLCAARFGAPVYVPGAAGEGERAYGDEERLPGGCMSVMVRRGPEGSYAALVQGDPRTALTGELVVGGPDNTVELELPAALAEERPAIAHALRGVLACYATRVFVAHGTAVLKDGDRTLQDLVYRHDPAAFLVRTSELRWDPPQAKAPITIGSRFGVRFAECAWMMGLKVLEFDMAEVPPGKQSVQLHRHDGEEECFIIMAGQGEVLTTTAALDGDQPDLATLATPIQAGDVLGFAPRYQVAHAIRNTGSEPLRYLCFGAPAETLDLCEYPETGVRTEVTRFGKRARFIPPKEASIPYWEGVRKD
ncbi:MAG TPA: cupin domain-containing protein [Chloroflexota bacterium]|nr:cupin domain-containing protein [Chloroflexota bacterium]